MKVLGVSVIDGLCFSTYYKFHFLKVLSSNGCINYVNYSTDSSI